MFSKFLTTLLETHVKNIPLALARVQQSNNVRSKLTATSLQLVVYTAEQQVRVTLALAKFASVLPESG